MSTNAWSRYARIETELFSFGQALLQSPQFAPEPTVCRYTPRCGERSFVRTWWLFGVKGCSFVELFLFILLVKTSLSKIQSEKLYFTVSVHARRSNIRTLSLSKVLIRHALCILSHWAMWILTVADKVNSLNTERGFFEHTLSSCEVIKQGTTDTNQSPSAHVDQADGL